MDKELTLVFQAIDGGSEKTVGDLRKAITELRNALLNTNKESKEYNDILEHIGTAQGKITNVMNETRDLVKHQQSSYYALNQELVNLRRSYKELTEEERNSEAGVSQLGRIQELDTQLKALDATMGQHQRNVGHYELAIQALNKDYANSRQELAAMKSAMDNLDPASQEYAQAFQRAADITHQMAERQELLKYSSRDLGDQLSNIRGIASNMAAGFSAAQAAIGLFGGESKEVQQAMLKVQQAMALVQGLQGMEGLLKRTQGLTNALRLNRTEQAAVTVATKADTVAKQGEAVATETATVAQKGLNAAMKANPIGAVIIAVQALITVWALFKDKIVEAIGGQERLNNIMNTSKPIVAGVGNAIIQFLITPIKQFLVTIKGVAAVVDDIIHGKFKQAWKDAGTYANEWAETTIKGINVVANYEKGASDARVKIAEKETKKKQEQYDKDKDNYIKDQEAMHGSDWKYTDEGKKAYEELYKNKMNMYDKDSEEFRQAQRDMWAYQRDYDDRRKKSSKGVAKAAKDDTKEIHDAWKSLVDDYFLSDTDKAFNTALSRIKASLEEYVAIGAEYSGQIQEEMRNIWAPWSGEGSWAGGLFDAWRDFLAAHVKEIGTEAKELVRLVNEDVSKPIVEDVLNSLSTIETNAKATADKLYEDFSNKEFMGEIIFPKDALDAAMKEYETYQQAYTDMIAEVDKGLEELRKHGLQGTEQYQRLEVKKTEILNDESRRRMERMRKEADIMQKEWDRQLTNIEAMSDEAKRKAENAMTENNSDIRSLLNGMSVEDERRLMETIYAVDMEALERKRGVYEKIITDERASYEQREQARENLRLTMAEIEDKELQHTVDVNTKRIEAWKEWTDMAKEAVGAIADLIGGLADYYEADVEARVKAGKITEAQADREYENIKRMKIAEVLINTLAGSIGAYLQAVSTYPPPAGEIIGAISAAAVAAAGAAQIKKIKSSSRSGSSSSSALGAQATPTQSPYQPQYVENPTGANETHNLRNALMEQPIYVRVTDIDNAQRGRKTRVQEASF